MRYLSLLTFLSCGWGAFGCSHAQFVFSVNVTIHYTIVAAIVAVIIAVVIAEMTFNL